MISSATKAVLASTRPIGVSLSPYTYVRTTVMASKLFRAEDYQRMLRLSIPEIIQVLEESTYEREIDELATTEGGVFLIEHVVQRNFWRTVDTLRKISDDDLRFFIDLYVWRNDIQNLKTLIRGKRSGEPYSTIRTLLFPGTLTKVELETLYGNGSVDELLNAVRLPFVDDAAAIYAEDGAAGLETELTRRYYVLTHTIAKRLRGGNERFRDFLLLEIDTINILTVCKLKRGGDTAENIHRHLIEVDDDRDAASTIRDRKRHAVFERIADAPDLETVFTILSTSRFAPLVREGIARYHETGSLLDLERRLQANLLRRAASMSHLRPLQPDGVVSFLFAKVIEARNIMLLIKGKELGVSTAFLEQELIYR